MNFATAPQEIKEQLADRADLDVYITEPAVCHTALKIIAGCFERFNSFVNPGSLLDPGAGTGNWGQAARDIWPHARITGVEIRPEVPAHPAYDTWVSGESFIRIPTPVWKPRREPRTGKEALKLQSALRKYELRKWVHSREVFSTLRTFGESQTFDLVIGNPPYEDAEAFIKKCFFLLNPGGVCIFLLRLAFLEGQERGEEFFPVYTPRYSYVMSKRPSFFQGDHPKAGKTDAAAYMICIWQKGFVGEPILRWFPIIGKSRNRK